MTETLPRIFDPAALRRNRARALRRGMPAFLHAAVAQEVEDRFATILRRFGRVLVHGAAPSDLAQRISDSGKADEVLTSDIAPESGAAMILDSEALPFADGSLDAVLWVLGLEAVNDLPGTLLQIRRALKPDGVLIAGILGGDSLSELRQAWLTAESEVSDGVSPRVAPFADVRDWGGLLQRAGFALPVVDTDRLTARYANALGLMQDLRELGLANPLAGRRRSLTPFSLAARAADVYGQAFADEDGRIRATFQIVYVTGWAPHESQQKPLKPGSAKLRLADALRVPERRFGEDSGSEP